MFKKVLPVAIALVLAAGATGCTNKERGGGGGGTTVTNERHTTGTMGEKQGTGTTTTGQAKSNVTMGDNMSKAGKGYAEAYARAPWVHSNLAVRDWERALDDLHYVRDHVDDLLKDADVPKDTKTSLAALKTDIAKLDTSIRKHDVAALAQSKMLVDRFAAELQKPMITAWFGEHKGGGAGTGTHTNTNTMKK